MKVTKLVLWITALVLIIALGFSVISTAVKNKGGSRAGQVTSKQVKNTQKFTDGLPKNGLFKYETKIAKEGKYRIAFEPDLKSKTFVIGSEVFDTEGNMIGAFVLFSGEEVTKDYEFKKGTVCIEYRYITTEQDFKDFVGDFDASFGDITLKEALKKVQFSRFNEDGSVSVNIKTSISAVKGTQANYVDLAVLTGVGIALLAVLIVLGVLYKQVKPAEPEVYDGTAPEVPEVLKKPAVNQGAYAYNVPVQQYAVQPMWICSACGERENTGRFCANCGQPAPAGVQTDNPASIHSPSSTCSLFMHPHRYSRYLRLRLFSSLFMLLPFIIRLPSRITGQSPRNRKTPVIPNSLKVSRTGCLRSELNMPHSASYSF